MTLKKYKPFFHPLEISFIGYSNSGKTTLISKIIKKLSSRFDIGFVKHDAHHYSMDHEGKDTDIATKSGASKVLISCENEGKSSYLMNDHSELSNGLLLDLINLDFVLIEGFKDYNIPKFIMLDSQNTMLDKFKENELENVLGFIGTSEQISNLNYPHMRVFNRDDEDQIISFILDLLSTKIKNFNINGLVLGGGESLRMGRDKSALEYHGKTQVDFCLDLFKELNLPAHVSCRFEQKNEIQFKNKNHIYDQILNMGPAGGIWSALREYRETAFLVVACDLPFLNIELLKYLLSKRNPYKMATCFFNPEKNWREPLITIYEPKSFYMFGSFFALDKRCPRKMLRNSNVLEVELLPENLHNISNINTQSEYLETMEVIKDSYV